MATIGIDIQEASRLIKQGAVVAIPTETVYGLAANALDEKAVTQIFEVKNRPAFDPLIIHLHSVEQIHDYCIDIPDTFYKLYKAFCPGPITFILPKSQAISDLVTAGNSSVGIRFPKHELSRNLLQKLNIPLAAPSANPFGYVSPTTAMHVAQQLSDKIPYILDGGACEIGLESTIVEFIGDSVKVLRLGGLSIEEIEAVLGASITQIKTSSSNPKAPGMLSSHYAPSKKVIFGDMEANYRIFKGAKLGSITFKNPVLGIPKKNQWILSPKGDLKEAASQLFKVLRETDQTDLEVILAEKFPNEGLGRAINDRLKRASAQ